MKYIEFLQTVAPYVVGPMGGFFVTFLLLLGVARMHRTCEKNLQRVASAYSELGAALNFMAGSEVVKANTLQDVAAGKGAVKYKAATKARRIPDGGLSHDTTGGAADVR